MNSLLASLVSDSSTFAASRNMPLMRHIIRSFFPNNLDPFGQSDNLDFERLTLAHLSSDQFCVPIWSLGALYLPV